MDQIQSKLYQLDKRLKGFGGLVKERISASPVLFIAIGLILGVIIQNTFEMPLWCWCVFLGFLFLAALILFCHLLVQSYCGNIKNPVSLATAVLLCALCLGAIRLITYRQAAPNDIRNFVNDKPVLATIRGTIISEPYVNSNENWKFAKFSHSDPTSSFYLKLTETESVDGWAKVKGIIRVGVNEPILDLSIGEHIEACCILENFTAASNPGQFCSASHFAGNNIYAKAVIKSGEAITILSDRDSPFFVKFKNKIRQIAYQAVLGDVQFQDESRAILEALLLGLRTNIGNKTYRAFEKTGLLHFISLSGMHLGIIVAVFWWFGKLFGLLKPARAIVCMAAVALFLLVIPPRPPTVRAAIICFVFGFSVLFGRKADSLNSLSLAAVILLLIRPTGLFEPGWQLSFSAVLGILLISAPIINYLKMNLGSLGKFVALKPLLLFILELFAVGIGAWIAGAGVLLYHFYTLNLFTSIWTILAFPFVAAILTIGFLKALFYFLFPTASVFLGSALYFLSKALILLVEFFSKIPLNEILIGSVSLWLIVVYYILAAMFGWACFQRQTFKKIIVAAFFFALILYVFAGKLNNNSLSLTCLDVGHGQAVILQTPKHCFIFDAGSQYNHDVGNRIIRPFLRYAGIKKIDGIIISHDDTDHINGIPEIIQNHRVKNIYATSAFIDKSVKRGTAKYLAACFAEYGLSMRPLTDKLEAKNVNIDILWPDKAACSDELLSDNNKSVVSLIEFADRKILICSDIEGVAQNLLLQKYRNISADVVIVPHHGSKKTAEDDFLIRIDGQYMICSSGQRHYQKLRNENKQMKARWFYTAKDGAVSVKISGKGRIAVNSFANK